jgi:hypothetical protein
MHQPDEPTRQRPDDRRKPWVPHTVHLREFRLPDGRPLLIDRRGVAFLVPVQGSPDKVIIGLKVHGAKPCPVMATYDDVKAWWYGGTNGGGREGK